MSGCAVDSPGEQSTPPAAEAVEPAIARDFPDPDVLRDGDRYFAYATNANLRNVQVAISDDLEQWELQSEDALPELPTWVIPGKTWAPEVTSFAPGEYTMYFTATDAESGRQCIGRAVATDPLGPFASPDTGMLVCPVDEGGAIDAGVAEVDGAPYLLWKNDGNCCGQDTWLYASPLSPDGSTITGERIPLIKQTEDWEGDLVEAPTLVERGDSLVLLYSANGYGGDEYAVGLATAPALVGPWTKNPEPLLETDGSPFRGPGGQDLVNAPDGSPHLVIHSWNRSYSAREMHVVPAEWRSDTELVLTLP
nr:glycoside hydrolase family 43 protein [Microcella alkalica]